MAFIWIAVSGVLCEPTLCRLLQADLRSVAVRNSSESKMIDLHAILLSRLCVHLTDCLERSEFQRETISYCGDRDNPRRKGYFKK